MRNVMHNLCETGAFWFRDDRWQSHWKKPLCATEFPNPLTGNFNWLILLSKFFFGVVEPEMHVTSHEHVIATLAQLGKNSNRCPNPGGSRKPGEIDVM